MNGKPWQPYEIAYMQARYPHVPTWVICTSLDRTDKSVYMQAKEMGLYKTAAFLASESSGRIQMATHKGRLHQFKKGQQPVNKGKRWQEFMTPEGMAASRKTQFGKGHLPHNTRADGEISIRPNKTGRPYKFIRVALGKWVPLHVHLWQQAHGPVPKGKIIVFRDKDTMNCTLENLELITRQENMKRNTYHNYGHEIASAIQLRGALHRKINNKLKTLKHEK